MTVATTTILREKTVFNDKLVIEEGEIQAGNDTFTRLRVNREDAVAVLLLNTDTNKIILTRQFRYAIAHKTQEPILELVAGKMDKKEGAIDTAIRETEEETGYKVKKENIQVLLSCFVTPGYSSERFIVYYATVANADRASAGGGLKDEHEDIEVVEMDVQEFVENVKGAHFKDAKTYIAGLYLLSKKMLA
jgi:ADP-ribose pyrophosphatase